MADQLKLSVREIRKFLKQEDAVGAAKALVDAHAAVSKEEMDEYEPVNLMDTVRGMDRPFATVTDLPFEWSAQSIEGYITRHREVLLKDMAKTRKTVRWIVNGLYAAAIASGLPMPVAVVEAAKVIGPKAEALLAAFSYEEAAK